MIRPSAPEELTGADLLAEAGGVLELEYVQPDTCALPALVIKDDQDSIVKVVRPGSTWTCEHGITWTVVWVQIRGGMAQPSWIIRPPVEPTTPTT